MLHDLGISNIFLVADATDKVGPSIGVNEDFNIELNGLLRREDST